MKRIFITGNTESFLTAFAFRLKGLGCSEEYIESAVQQKREALTAVAHVHDGNALLTGRTG